MAIATTVNLGEEAAKKLNESAKEAGVTRSELAVVLMQRLMREHGKMAQNWRPVRYQKKVTGKAWRRLHVSFGEKDYEFCIDMRNFFKASVSGLLAFAIRKYLDELMKQDTMGRRPGIADNYSFHAYAILCEEVENAVCWRIFWNIPPTPSKIFPE